MHVVAASLTEPTGQGWVQVAEPFAAFALSSLIGLERQLRGESAGCAPRPSSARRRRCSCW
jgi:putative Mg2+ transporter-C (MgtC) family protein